MYKMKLCRPANLKEYLQNPDYFHTHEGVLDNNLLIEIEDLIVNESFFNKNYVTEIISGFRIPSINLTIDYKDEHFGYCVYGENKEPYFAFTTIDANPKKANQTFYKKSVSKEECQEYIETHTSFGKEYWMNYLNLLFQEERRRKQIVLRKIEKEEMTHLNRKLK